MKKFIVFLIFLVITVTPLEVKAMSYEETIVGIDLDRLNSVISLGETTLVGLTAKDLIKLGDSLNIDNDIYKNFDLMCAVVEAEAQGGTYEQKLNVASCIVNRRNMVAWCPNDIYGVIWQPGQFSVIWSGRYLRVKITEDTKKAVTYLLTNKPVHGCHFFCSAKARNGKTFKNMTPEFWDGMHYHFK